MTPSPGTDTSEAAPDGIMVVGGADRGRSVGNDLRPLDARDLGAFSGCLGRCCSRLTLTTKTKPTMVALGPLTASVGNDDRDITSYLCSPRSPPYP